MLRFGRFAGHILSLTTAIWIGAFAQVGWADSITAAEYGYPQEDGAFATLSAATYHAELKNVIPLDISQTDRRIRRYGRLQKFHMFFAPAPTTEPRPLIVVIAGLGDSAQAPIARYLASLTQQTGAAALMVPNTFTANFAVAISPSGVVGQPSRDVERLKPAIEQAIEHLQKTGARFSSVSIVGYSHGAILTGYLRHQGLVVPGVPVRSYLMINPPVDLVYGMKTLDAYARQTKHIPLFRLIRIATGMKKAIKRSQEQETCATSDGEFQTYLKNHLKLTEDEAKAAIGTALSAPLSRVILASQDVHDMGILPAWGLEGSAVKFYQDSARRQAASGYDYIEYANKFVGSFIREQGFSYTLEDLNARNSLWTLEEELRTSPDIYIIHSADDFLLRPGDAAWIESTFGRRALIYPHGGHTGNLWFPVTRTKVEEWIQTGGF